MSEAYLLVSHGSKDSRQQVMMEGLAKNLGDRLESCSNYDASGGLLSPTKCDYRVGAAYLELQPQSLQQQIVNFSKQVIDKGCRTLRILPLFLLEGIHVTEDIPREVELAQQILGADISIQLQPYLGSYWGLQNLLAKKIADRSLDGKIIIAHGSRRVEANTSIEAIAISVNAVAAYWAVSPSLKDIVFQLVADGKKKIVVFPYFLFPGVINDTIAQSIQEFELQDRNIVVDVKSVYNI